jgi:hypothetical protein
MRPFIILAGGIIIILAYIKYLEKKGLYYPVKEIEFYPDSVGLPFEDVYLNTQDGVKINGWFIPHPKTRYTLLFCHGNAGNIGNRMDKILLLRKLDLNIFIIDYRGFGKSQGRPTEKGFYLDAQAAYNYLLNARKITPQEIILYGESLGTAVAIDLAAKQKVKALILEGAFSSGKDMAVTIYPFLPKFIFSNMFDSLTKIKKIDAAKLFIHSRNDEIVPFTLATKLFNAAKDPKYFLETAGDHNNSFLDFQEDYISSIAAFIKKL